MKIKEYIRPADIKEACELLSCEGAAVIAGGAFLNLSEGEISKAIDLSGLGLEYIKETDDGLELGAMTTLRDLETNSITKNLYGGVLADAAASVMGVQLRNIATLGGSIYGKYGFSDLLTVLLALNAKVELYKGGLMSLERYLDSDLDKDILLRVFIGRNVSKAAFANVRKSSTDFSVLNAAAAVVKDQLRIAVGSRPGRARLAKGAMNFLEIIGSLDNTADMAGVLAAEELQFGSDMRASAEYRKELCKVLVKRCVQEVLQ